MIEYKKLRIRMFLMIYSIFYFYLIKHMARIISFGRFKKKELTLEPTELSLIFKKSQIKDKTRKLNF